MERRKLQIQSKMEEIIEEKNLLQSYMDKIVNQIQSCVDFVNCSKKLKAKDCSLVLKHQLDVLKRITEMNFELECVMDQIPPFEGMKTPDYSCMAITEKQEPTELPQESEISITTCSSVHFEEVYSGNRNVDEEIQDNCSDIDIQSIRDTLKKFNEKLGLNPDYISSLTDIYQKPSTSCITDYCDKPSSSQVTRCSVDSTNLGLEKDVSNGFEIPEKDTNKSFSFEDEVKENCCDVLQKVESSNMSENVDTKSSPLHPAHDSNLFEIVQEDIHKKSESEKVYTVDESSSDFSYENMTTSSSSEDCVTNDCLIPLVDENSLVIGNIVDEGQIKTDDNVKSTSEVVYTALQKLNNMTFFDRQAEAVAKMQPVNKPDISLKPTEHRIKNNLEPNDKKSKKKKNKKNKFREMEFYEIVPKSTPEVGTDCAFSHVETPNEFYLHVVDEESMRIDDLTEQLNNMFVGTVTEYNSKEEAFNAIGIFCFSFVTSYNSWYRAQILDWELDKKSEDVVVQFVDYGDKRRTSYKNLRRMTKELAEIPMLAVRCHLALMYPPDSTYTNRLTEWPTATIDALMDLSGLMARADEKREKIFRIVYANSEGESVSIDLYNLQDNEEQTVGQVLLDLGLAVQIIDEYDDTHPELDVFLQDVNSLETAENINEAVMGYDPKDEVRICRFAKSDGTCYKGKNCKLEHIPFSKDGFTTDKIPVFKEAMDSLMLPAKGEYVNILITAYKDICSFFIQIIWKPRKEKRYMIDESLYSLLADMNMPKTVRSYESFKVAPAIGEIVIVKHWSNKCLRAVVREEIAGNDGQFKYQVFTLDFGEYMNVTLEELRKIKPHFLELPFQAVECYLHNSVARQDCDKKKAKQFFLENLYYRNFVACTMSSSLPLKVAVTTFDRKDIGKNLVELGFAKDRVCDVNPADDFCLDLF